MKTLQRLRRLRNLLVIRNYGSTIGKSLVYMRWVGSGGYHALGAEPFGMSIFTVSPVCVMA
jgi:hypothetical protein